MIECCPNCGTAVNGIIRTTNPAQYGIQCPICGWERIDGEIGESTVAKIITNADRIRSMTDEELADFICGIYTLKEDMYGDCDYRLVVDGNEFRDDDGLLEWLKSAVEADT